MKKQLIRLNNWLESLPDYLFWVGMSFMAAGMNYVFLGVLK